jgi:hypothetical protein
VILSGMMSFLVTCITTAKALGFQPGFVAAWMEARAFAWPVACAAVLMLEPIVRRLVAKLTTARPAPSA